DGARRIRDAIEAVGDADSRVTELREENALRLAFAQENLEQATAIANERLARGAESAFTAQNKLNDAFVKASPAARTFTNWIKDNLFDTLEDLEARVQQAFFLGGPEGQGGLLRGLKEALPALPGIERGFVEIGRVFGALAERFGRVMGSEEW